MNNPARLLLPLCIFIPALVFAATDIPLEFTNAEQEQRYRDLTEELRCLVCQNQSLADSNSELAHDLRMEVYKMLVSGKENEAIVDYLVHRYGDFVLYRPPFKLKTILLWFGPLIFLGIGIIIVRSIVRQDSDRKLSEDEKKYADDLLQRGSTGDRE